MKLKLNILIRARCKI